MPLPAESFVVTDDGAADPVRARHQGDESADGDHDADRGEGALADERFEVDVLSAIDAEEHDHEQEEHDDGAGVDDDLHRGEEVGRLRDEGDGDADQRHDQAQRGVHGVLHRDDTDRADRG